MPTTEETGEEVTTEETGEELEETTLDDGENVEGEGESNDEEESETFQVGEHEITLEGFEEMQNQQMMHKAFTQKTQQLATDRRKLEETVRNEDTGVLKAHITALEELIADIDNVDVDDLTNKEFQDLERKRTKRGKVLEEAKKGLSGSIKLTQSELLDRQEELARLMPGWVNADGKLDDDLVQEELALITKTANAHGLDPMALADPKIYLALLESGKYRALKSKADITGKHKVKTSKSTKPSNQKTSTKKSREEIFYGTG